ncbi:MAG: hypothetical protein AB1424_03325 [Thermodesulfobacteriota bacterium]
MQSENVKEYEMVREEMSSVKDCITKYIGFVLGGSGAAVFLIARMGQNLNKENLQIYDFESGFVCLSLSIIINFVLLILFYKFHSHNRFAGYCKLLNHERHKIVRRSRHIPRRWPFQPTGDSSIFAWEVAVGMLRDQDIKKKLLDVNITIANIDIEKLRECLEGIYGQVENYEKIKILKRGLVILGSAIFGNIKTKSWAFPPLITAMLCVLSFGFFIIGDYYLIKYLRLNYPKDFLGFFALFLIFAVSVSQLVLWYFLAKRLQYLMEGGETVESFFWKFMPIRAAFLNKDNIIPEYLDANLDTPCFEPPA